METVIKQLQDLKCKNSNPPYNSGWNGATDFAVKKIKEFDLNSYLETYYEVVSFINRTVEDWEGDTDSSVNNTLGHKGRGGLWELATEWTNEFQEKYKDYDWEDATWFDTLEDFLTEKNTK